MRPPIRLGPSGDSVLDNLDWLQRTRAQRLADDRFTLLRMRLKPTELSVRGRADRPRAGLHPDEVGERCVE